VTSSQQLEKILETRNKKKKKTHGDTRGSYTTFERTPSPEHGASSKTLSPFTGFFSCKMKRRRRRRRKTACEKLQVPKEIPALHKVL